MTHEEFEFLRHDLAASSKELNAISGALGCLQKQVGELVTDPGEVSFLMYGFNGMYDDLRGLAGMLEEWAKDLKEKGGADNAGEAA